MGIGILSVSLKECARIPSEKRGGGGVGCAISAGCIEANEMCFDVVRLFNTKCITVIIKFQRGADSYAQGDNACFQEEIA